MLGYGAALTDASAFMLVNLKAKNLELYSYTINKLLSPTKGAGFSFLRLAMGASDYVATKSYYTTATRNRRTGVGSASTGTRIVAPGGVMCSGG